VGDLPRAVNERLDVPSYLRTPELTAVGDVNQFHMHEQIITLPKELSKHYVANVELFSDLLRSCILRRDISDRAVCQDAERGYLGKSIDDARGNLPAHEC